MFFIFELIMAYGVIGNTPVFGTDIQGSSPCRPTKSFIIVKIMKLFFDKTKKNLMRVKGLQF